MRRIAPALAFTVMTLLAIYPWLRNDPPSAPDTDRSTDQFDARLGALERSLTDYERAHAERWKEWSTTQSSLNGILTDLHNQIESLAETPGGGVRQEAATISDDVADDPLLEDDAPVDGQPPRPSEAVVGRLINAGFEAGHWDATASELARTQASEVVAQLPGVNLADMVCNEQLCRAMFIKLDGGQPDIGDIWGHPPFLNDGFTINQDDGSVVLYYAQEGVLLDDVREELLASR